MPTRYAAAVQYSSSGGRDSDGVNVEIDVSATTGKEYDASAGRWRNPDGTFASPPDVSEGNVRAEMERVRDRLVENMKRRGKRSLASSIENADIGIESGELVGGAEGRADGRVDNVIRFKDGDGNIEGRYSVDDLGNVNRRDH